MASINRIPVFIVGGGPVGLALALALERFPHRWMDAARTETTLDWFDQEFVLVTGTEGTAWLEAGADVARRLRVPLGLKQWPASHEAALEIGCGMGRRGAVLVRPEVTWRGAWPGARAIPKRSWQAP